MGKQSEQSTSSLKDDFEKEGKEYAFGKFALRLAYKFQDFYRDLESEDSNDALFHILSESLRMVRDELVSGREREIDKILLLYQDNFIVANSSLEEKNESYQFSRSVVKNVIQNNKPYLSQDIKTDAQFKDAESVRILDIHSLICVPLRFMGECIGAIYVDSHSIEGFTKKDLDYMENFSLILSPFIYSTREFFDRKAYEKKDKLEIIGESEALKEVLGIVAKVASSDATILLEGETGTGKELVAHLIHSKSQRSKKSFVSVNCAAIPSSLLESELFGHEKGAFTGAFGRKLGRFELADEGTLFLDEIAELDSTLQSKLLRVLEEREIERVGGIEAIPVDIRIIAATNRDLKKEVDEGRFRNDLFYRLKVICIQLPPLRKRKEDISLLVEYFIDKLAAKSGKGKKSVSPEVLKQFNKYPWVGNIRELRNVMEQMVLLCDRQVIELKDIPADIREYSTGKESRQYEKGQKPAPLYWKNGLLQLEKQYGYQLKEILEDFLDRCKYEIGIQNMEDFVSYAQAVFGDSKSTIYEYIKKYHLEEKRIELGKSLRKK
jgi:transcriptional regulator with GAF, ATPase, and Fis domain